MPTARVLAAVVVASPVSADPVLLHNPPNVLFLPIDNLSDQVAALAGYRENRAVLCTSEPERQRRFHGSARRRMRQ